LPGLDIDAVGLFLRGYRTFHAFSPASALASVTVLGGVRRCPDCMRAASGRQAGGAPITGK
jgi:hypothetical protein